MQEMENIKDKIFFQNKYLSPAMKSGYRTNITYICIFHFPQTNFDVL
jgi:hypothetical protein